MEQFAGTAETELFKTRKKLAIRLTQIAIVANAMEGILPLLDFASFAAME